MAIGGGHGEKVYNPWAILKCFDTREFSNFWWASGTPSMLLKIAPNLKEPENMENVAATDLSLLFDIEDIQSEALLWQTGYLTIKKVTGSLLTLGFPNAEVREAWSAMMLNRFRKNAPGPDGNTVASILLESLKAGNHQTFEKAIISLFASIPYDQQIKQEAFYHAIFVAALQAAGGRLIAEPHTDKGRVDVVLHTPAFIYIIEFKLGAATEALAQIKEKRYYEPYLSDSRQLILLGAGGFAEKNITCVWEEVAKP